MPSLEEAKVSASAAFNLLACDVRLQLMMPWQIASGMVLGLVYGYIYGEVIGKEIGLRYEIAFSAGAMWVGVFFALFCYWLVQWVGHGVIMTIGSISYGMTGVLLMSYSNEGLAQWQVIVPFFVLYGIGNSVYVSANSCQMIFKINFIMCY
jgi:hypothetical protein